MIATGNDTPSTAMLSNEQGIVGEKPLYFFLERYMDSFKEEMNCFVKAIINDDPVPVGVYDGLKSVIIGMAARKSLKEGRHVKISEIQL